MLIFGKKIDNEKQSKKVKKQERKQKELRGALHLLSDTNVINKPKRQKKFVEIDSETESDMFKEKFPALLSAGCLKDLIF